MGFGFGFEAPSGSWTVRLSFFNCRSLPVFLAIRFESIVDCRFWPELGSAAFGFSNSDVAFPTPPRTQLSRSTDRLQLIAGRQLRLPAYQLPTYNLAQSRSSLETAQRQLSLSLCVQLSEPDSSINLTSWAGPVGSGKVFGTLNGQL